MAHLPNNGVDLRYEHKIARPRLSLQSTKMPVLHLRPNAKFWKKELENFIFNDEEKFDFDGSATMMMDLFWYELDFENGGSQMY